VFFVNILRTGTNEQLTGLDNRNAQFRVLNRSDTVWGLIIIT